MAQPVKLPDAIMALIRREAILTVVSVQARSQSTKDRTGN